VLATLLVVVFALVILLWGLAAILGRKDYGTFAFWKVPSHIGCYCGRRYYDAGSVPVVLRGSELAR